MSHLVDAHIAYIKTISDLNQDKAELQDRIKRLEEAGEKMVDEPLRKHRRWILNEAKEDKP